MKILLDLPAVLFLGNWVWGEDESPDVSPELCLEAFPAMHMDCWKGLMAKCLGIAIILGSCLNKLPIMRNILDSKSTEGLSRASTYSDALIYANGAFYGLLQDHPFTAFGENIALLLQTLAIILMLWHFSQDSVSGWEHVGVIAGAAAYVGLVVFVLPDDQHVWLPASNWPVYIYARASQIMETSRLKHTGAQSIVTIGMNVVGSLIRILTTLEEVGLDFGMLTSYILGVVLNFTMFVQYFYYKDNTDKFVQQQKSKKES